MSVGPVHFIRGSDGPLGVPVSPRLPGGKDPFWQGFQCEEKKMERAVDEDHDFGGMSVKYVQVKRLGRVV